MSNFINFYMKVRNIKSFVVGLITGLMLIVIFTSAAFGQETPTPTPEKTEIAGRRNSFADTDSDTDSGCFAARA